MPQTARRMLPVIVPFRICSAKCKSFHHATSRRIDHRFNRGWESRGPDNPPTKTALSGSSRSTGPEATTTAKKAEKKETEGEEQGKGTKKKEKKEDKGPSKTSTASNVVRPIFLSCRDEF